MNNQGYMQVIDDEASVNQASQVVEQDKEMQMLDLINRVQMFQIASSRVNQNLLQRKKLPVFNLQFTENFEGQDGEKEISEMDELASVFGSEVNASKVDMNQDSMSGTAKKDLDDMNGL